MKIFLYPENWVAPDLRSNKTPFFKDLETTLLQGAVTSDNVEVAYLAYLQSLQQVARLEIAGLYTEDDSDAQMVHVIGRTFTAPYVYFYRKLDTRTYAWSAWEQVGADISGDTLVPMIWNRRLFLFWPLYNETTDPTQNSSASPQITTASNSGSGTSTAVGTPPPSTKTLQIQLAWSEYKDGQWTTKQVTADSLSPTRYRKYSSQLDTSYFIFTAETQNDDGLVVTAYSTSYVNVDDFMKARADLSNASALMSSVIQKLGANSSTKVNFTSSPGTGINAAVKAASDDIANLLKDGINNALYPVQLQGASNTIETVLNDVTPPSAATPAQFGTLIDSLNAAANYLVGLIHLAPLGSFSFDGSQAVVEIDTNSSGDARDIDNFGPIVSIYQPPHDRTTPIFRFQDLSLMDSSFNLAITDSFSPNPQTALLLATGKNISTQTISFPEQRIPAYTVDIGDSSLKKGLFFADRRRTYFVANSVTPDKLKDATRSSSPKDDAKGSFYFFNHYHPWVGELIKRLNWKGISYLLHPDTQGLGDPSGYSFKSYYGLDIERRRAVSGGERRLRPDGGHHGRRAAEGLCDAGRRLCLFDLQLGAFLLHAVPDRDTPEPEPAIRRRADLVPLHLQSHPGPRVAEPAERLCRQGTQRILEFPAAQRDRRQGDAQRISAIGGRRQPGQDTDGAAREVERLAVRSRRRRAPASHRLPEGGGA